MTTSMIMIPTIRTCTDNDDHEGWSPARQNQGIKPRSPKCSKKQKAKKGKCFYLINNKNAKIKKMNHCLKKKTCFMEECYKNTKAKAKRQERHMNEGKGTCGEEKY